MPRGLFYLSSLNGVLFLTEGVGYFFIIIITFVCVCVCVCVVDMVVVDGGEGCSYNFSIFCGVKSKIYLSLAPLLIYTLHLNFYLKRN